MSPYTTSPSKKEIYDLYSIIVHHGSSGSGHFLAYIWSPDNDSWFEMNDSHTRPATPDVVFEQNAYMLFYLKRNQSQSQSKSLMPDLESQDSSKIQKSENRKRRRIISSDSSE